MSAFPPDLREWIANKYAKGVDIAVLKELLKEQGFAEADIDLELTEMQSHPYLLAYKETYLDLQKREWMMNMLNRKYQMNRHFKIERKKKLPPFKTFLKNYYLKNMPVVIENAFNNWPAKNWTPELILEKCGNPNVQVQYGREGDPNFEQNSDKYKTTMPLREFMQKVKEAGNSNNIYLTANNSHMNREAFAPLYEEVGQIGDDYMRVDIVKKFGYLWIGPAGTFTPTHHDTTDIMFFQIYGRKRFWFAPSLSAPLMHNSRHVYSHAEIARPDFDKFPSLRYANIMQVDVGPGDAIFLPAGWWHAVEALEPSISFSSMAFNAPNDDHNHFPKTYSRY